MSITFAVKIVRVNVYMTIDNPKTDLHSQITSQTGLLFNLQYLGQYLMYYIQTWHDGILMDAIYAHARFDDLNLDARSQWVGKGKYSALNYFDN